MEKMTHYQILLCIVMSICGQLLDLFLIQVPEIRKQNKAANKPFSFRDWWNCDWNTIIATQVIIIMVTIGWDQLVGWKPWIVNFAKWIYAGIGGFGSSIAMAHWGSYKKGLTALSSIKSNIADLVTGGTTTVKETIEKGEEKLQKDVTQNPA